MHDERALCFIDTNIWLYACITGDNLNKGDVANRLIRNQSPILSTQVINEVCVNLIKKARFGEDRIRLLIDAFYKKYPVVEPDCAVLREASLLRERYKLSFWDGLIVATARLAGVTVLYSEDMQHGLVLDGTLRIVNPFVEA